LVSLWVFVTNHHWWHSSEQLEIQMGFLVSHFGVLLEQFVQYFQGKNPSHWTAQKEWRLGCICRVKHQTVKQKHPKTFWSVKCHIRACLNRNIKVWLLKARDPKSLLCGNWSKYLVLRYFLHYLPTFKFKFKSVTDYLFIKYHVLVTLS